MESTIRELVQRLKRVPRRAGDTWQGGLYPFPRWMVEDDRPPYRPSLPVWVDEDSGFVFPCDILAPENATLEEALRALAAIALDSEKAGFLPQRLRVENPQLAEFLRGALKELPIEVLVSPRLENVERFLQAAAEEFGGPAMAAGILDDESVTVERVRAFAAAAAEFYRAGVWNHLCDLDLVKVESGAPGPALSHTLVLGGAGLTYGLAFFASEEDFQEFNAIDDPTGYMRERENWYIDFDDITTMAYQDTNLWEDCELPVAGPEAYPRMYCVYGARKLKRPGAAHLSYAEGLLRALSSATEDDFDVGHWSRRVPTIDGEMEMTLALPAILAPADEVRLPGRGLPDRRILERAFRNAQRVLEEETFDSPEEAIDHLNRRLNSGRITDDPAPRDDRERALKLVDAALEARGRRQIKLARQALRMDPDCADAYVILAECMPDLEKKTELYRNGTAAGERTLGRQAFEEHAGHFWGVVETRPYMRARAGLAECLVLAGDARAALEHHREILRLNPDDNQGVRFRMIPLLLEGGDDDEAARVLDLFGDDGSASLAYCRALLAFRREGDSPGSRKLREEAVRANSHLIRYLTGKKELPESLPDMFAPGSPEEAALAAADLIASWERTPGAVEWLQRRRRDRKETREAKEKVRRLRARKRRGRR
ncbi:MAG: hypothetical protein GF355_02915 [Candidatus Eisenbacteria bacterium]|nr:hypothetical protein [Candidatus Eisenbacteria bacterium]